ncbi:MAG: M28 family metallopeptidase, partial [Pseudomonadales bacterium]
SQGEIKTINFLRDKFTEIGLKPGNGDSFFQPVPLVEITADPNITLAVDTPIGKIDLTYGNDMMVWTKRVTDSVALENSELVFVGYGIVAPEYNWNDYQDLDVKGKTVVILVNDPGFATQDDGLFNGNAMTYYGRWTYKYEEAARQGAAGAIIVHEDAAAGYPWAVVAGSWSGPQFDLVAEDENAARAAVEGWVTADAAKQLFSAASMDYEEAKAQALNKAFKATPMAIKASVAIKNTTRESTSNNVIAILPGSARPEETIFYTAHWDHLGKKEGDGDQIFNGAVDNASGTAALLELAEAFKGLKTPPQRSIVFLAVTAEESGLLGSRFYGENPVYPLATTVGAINIDAMNVLGKTRDITVVGYGSSELENYLKEGASKQNRVLKPEPTPEKGYFYRSDHFNFSKRGVPVLYAEGGTDYVDHDAAWGQAQQNDYTANRYHKPADEYDESWDLSGVIEDITLYFEIGHQLANETHFPNWFEGNEFRQIRDDSRASVQ